MEWRRVDKTQNTLQPNMKIAEAQSTDAVVLGQLQQLVAVTKSSFAAPDRKEEISCRQVANKIVSRKSFPLSFSPLKLWHLQQIWRWN